MTNQYIKTFHQSCTRKREQIHKIRLSGLKVAISIELTLRSVFLHSLQQNSIYYQGQKSHQCIKCTFLLSISVAQQIRLKIAKVFLQNKVAAIRLISYRQTDFYSLKVFPPTVYSDKTLLLAGPPLLNDIRADLHFKIVSIRRFKAGYEYLFYFLLSSCPHSFSAPSRYTLEFITP